MIKTFRRTVQISTILFIIAIPILNKKGITVFTGSLYSLAIGPVWITDPLSGFQVIITTLDINKTLLLSILIPVIIAFALGRVFCSYMCPQNTISEIFDRISEKIPPFLFIGATRRVVPIITSARPRYVIMIILLVLTPLLGFPVANLISAPGIISVQVTKYFYEETVGIELGLIGIIILSEIFVISRLWCNCICPVGSFLGLFRIKRTMKVVYTQDAEHVCGKCLECVNACQLGLNPVAGNIYPLCHNCGECISACEVMKGKEKTLSFKF